MPRPKIEPRYLRRTDVLTDDPRTDLRRVVIEDYEFPRAAVVDHHDARWGTVRVAYNLTEQRLQVTEFGVVEPRKNDSISITLMREVLDDYQWLVMYSVFVALAEDVNDAALDEEQIKATLREGKEMWRVLALLGLPARSARETTAEYVTRLWLEFYKPAGKTQLDLANDLQLKHITVRGYISDQTKTKSTKKGKR